MKLYIENYSIQKMKENMKNLHEYLKNTSKYLEGYSKEGIYCIKNNKMYKIKNIDSKIQKHINYYKKYTILVDNSNIYSELAHQINFDHILLETTLLSYSLPNNPSIKLMIEMSNPDIIRDFYFEIPENSDIENKLFKEELIVFLSLLN